MKNFQICGGDIDHTIYDRVITGRLTPKRYKTIMRYARMRSKRRDHCGHEWDCCGCVHATHMAVDFTELDTVYIQYTVNYNY